MVTLLFHYKLSRASIKKKILSLTFLLESGEFMCRDSTHKHTMLRRAQDPPPNPLAFLLYPHSAGGGACAAAPL